jgi:hypothetical protein
VTHRERFAAVLEGRTPDRPAFFPDITSWYVLTRIPLGDEQPFWPGQYIPDDSPFHEKPSRLEGILARLTFTGFYKQFDWGLPCHIYDWYEERLVGAVEKIVHTKGRHRSVRFHTPRGDLTRTYTLDAEGTWSEYGHMASTIADLEIVRLVVESTRFVPHHEMIHTFLRETEGFGICDLVVFRSPFGKLIHEYMGFEAVAYALHDDEAAVRDFLRLQEAKDLELIELAARAPGPIVIISDHADENLISPAWYRTWCIPYYQKACGILHAAGKVVSTHLDGNFKGYFGCIEQTGFDLLDGCTPAPMFNFEPEELAAATGGEGGRRRMSCYCGVPASLFATGQSPAKLADFAERIVQAFSGRVIVNVGDILPPNGNIDGVIEIGRRLSTSGTRRRSPPR